MPRITLSTLYFLKLTKSVQSKQDSQPFVYTGEAHKGHRQQTGRNQCDGHTTHAFRDIDQTQLFADTGKYNQGQGKAQGSRECINHACQQVIVFLNHQEGTHPVPDTTTEILFSG